MKILELFSGTESFSKIGRELGHETFTIDFDNTLNPNLCINMLDFEVEMLPIEWRNPDIIWASPPCTTFSVMSINRYWINQKPKTYKTYIGLALAMKTLEIIEKIKPKYFFIENPRGMLRKQHFMKYLKRDTVTYCKYGFEYMKPTDIWNNTKWIPRPICKPNSPCHVRTPRGSRVGIQGINGYRENRNQKHPVDISRLRKTAHLDWDYDIKSDALERGKIPPELCKEILFYCEGKKMLIQEVIQ